jgi:hypothetical protein
MLFLLTFKKEFKYLHKCSYYILNSLDMLEETVDYLCTSRKPMTQDRNTGNFLTEFGVSMNTLK